MIKLSNHIQVSILSLLLLCTIILSFIVYSKEQEKKALKTDTIELSNVKYGLFNVDQWKIRIAEILTKKVEDFKIDESNQKEMEEKIAGFLDVAISELEVSYKEENRRNSFFGFSFKNVGVTVFDIFGKMKRDIPNITKQIIIYLNDIENRNKIKHYILTQLDKYAAETFTEMDYTLRDNILAKYDSNNIESCNALIQLQLEEINNSLKTSVRSFYILIILIFFIFILLKNKGKLTLLIFILIAGNLLILGLLLPMIDIDARISTMSFKLLGENVNFENQILYFKSKSILEVVSLMLNQGEIKVLLVGLLVLIFSVLFPISKLISSILYLFNKQMRKSSIVRFLVFKIGKWSMADVMVIAIFMSYIGFSGIISEQLKQLSSITSNLDLLTTNNSELQNGFFFFTAFVILSLFISQNMQTNRNYDEQ